MNNKKQTKTKKKVINQQNVLESLKSIGSSTAGSLKKDLIGQSSKDIIAQILKAQKPRKYSGEVAPGESLEFNEIYSGKREENVKLQKQIALERKLRNEEKHHSEKKIGELRVHLQAITVEVQKLASETQGLAQETQIAAMQAPIEPGVYHIVFFEKLLEFIRSFRKKVHEASTWLHASNKRAGKKNYWSKYKKHGAKFLLSSEHYLTRSAG